MRRKAKLDKEKGKFRCPSCGKTEFDHMEDFGMKGNVMYDALACRNCPWTGAVPADKIRAVNSGD